MSIQEQLERAMPEVIERLRKQEHEKCRYLESFEITPNNKNNAFRVEIGPMWALDHDGQDRLESFEVTLVEWFSAIGLGSVESIAEEVYGRFNRPLERQSQNELI